MNDYRLNWNPPAEPLGAAIRPQAEPVAKPAPSVIAYVVGSSTDQDIRKFYGPDEEEKTEPAEPLTTSPSNAGWIEHDGGPCPAPRELFIEYMMSGDSEPCTAPAGCVDWAHDRDVAGALFNWCVIKWRLIQD